MKNLMNRITAISLAAVLLFSVLGATSAAAARKGFDPNKVGGKIVLTSFSDPVIFIWNRASDSASIDLMGMMFESLVKSDFNGQPIPGLATSWKFDKPSLTYTFNLRKGVKWHDGKPFTSKDVKATFDMYIDPDSVNTYKTDYESIQSVTIVDDYTVKFKLKENNVFFLTGGPASAGAILPAHHFPNGVKDYNAKNSKFGRNPIGTGPFKFKEWKTAERVVLVANKDWWDGRPYLDEIVTRILPDANVEALNLIKGDVDFVEKLNPRTLSEVAKNKNLKTITYDEGRFDYVGWNNKNPIFADKKVRQAMNYALDRQAIVSKIYLGKAYLGTGPMHPTLPQENKNVKPYPYDLKKAAELLDEAGWKKGSDGIRTKDGKKLELEVTYNNGNTNRQKIAQVFAADLKKLGIKANVRGYEWSLYLDKYLKGELDMFVLAWGGYDGATLEHKGFFHSSAIPDLEKGTAGNNRMRVDYPKVDKILEDYLTEEDASKRIKLYQELHAFLAEEAVAAFTHHPKNTAGMNKNLMGVKISMASSFFNIEDWYWKK
ncbi:peptide/nickel transport system substrate-binding protein [Paenibacillus castaneae]|uniref:ABC transporter substrate-binding protein n=1 Tax=Paenibacillus castaneae TaxID=474957 RepID=UPI000C9CAC1A|nr:ABC transporter substrate-binding protein [Paenibacillus castaneae]NIK76984.1 peptide/nickel transport system substrate-binding protein [Paenibacillus castaneae]